MGASDVSITDRLILFIVAGLPADRAARMAGIADGDVPAAVTEARRRLTLAADFHRDEQLGTAIARLNDCYSKAAADKDVKTCVAVQKELNRLMDLYRPTVRVVDETGKADSELAAVRDNLLPLNLAPPDAPASELARLAVAEIMELRRKGT